MRSTGLDSDLYASCTFAEGGKITEVPQMRKDVRDADVRDLDGFDAIIHLAALSNDPLGNLKPRHHLRHQPSGKRAPRRAGQGRRRQALLARLLMQQLRLRRRGHGGGDERRSTRSRPMAPRRSAPSVILPSSPATASPRFIFARRPPTASRRASASTSCSITSWPGR